MAVKDLAQSGILYTDRRDFYISPDVNKELWPDVKVFTRILMENGIETVTDPDFKMFEHRSGWVKQQLQINAGGPAAWANNGDPDNTLAADATVAVDGMTGITTDVSDGTLLGLAVEIWGELAGNAGVPDPDNYKGVALITGVAANAIKLRCMGNPRVANNRAVALADNDVLRILGGVFPEGSTSPEAYADELEVVWNSCGIKRTPVEITGTLYHQAKLRGASREIDRLRKLKMFEHDIQNERMLLFGVRVGGIGGGSGDDFAKHVTYGSHPARSTNGIIPTIYRYGATTGSKKNIFTVDPASYDYPTFVDDMEQLFRFKAMQGGVKRALCGPKAMSYWSKLSNTAGFAGLSGWNINLSKAETGSLGFQVSRLETVHGTLELTPMPIFDGPYAGCMLVIDPDNLSLKQYRPTVYKTNIKTENGYDGVKDEYFSDMGLGMTLVETNAIFNVL